MRRTLVAALTVHRQHGFFMNWFGNQRGEGVEYHVLALELAVALILSGGGAVVAGRADVAVTPKTRI